MSDDIESIHEKIRKLLALAEGAGTEAEAESASAAAMRLVQKYAVDLAMIADKRGSKGKPVSRQMEVTNPYGKPKVGILNVICINHGVKLIRLTSQGRGQVMMVGFEGDLEAVELLFASLVVQAFGAAERVLRDKPYLSGGDARAFKTSFLYGFQVEIRERLEKARRVTVDETPGSALVLRDRSKDVELAFKEMFPTTKKTSGGRISDSLGASAGRAAGARADLGQSRFSGGRKALA